MRRLIILTLPIFLIAALELLFRFGAWEPLAEPSSHAGLSIRLKNYLSSATLQHVDLVTLGSSRPVYGIDHKMLEVAAAEHGRSYVNMSIPGVHWMSIGILTNWLERHRPEVRGGIIALSIQDFSYPGNGSYELDVVEPFRSIDDRNWIEAHVPFQSGQVESWGTRYSLMAWRQDIRDFVQHPIKRMNRARKVALNPDPESVFGNQTLPGNMCAIGIESIAACDVLEVSNDADKSLLAQCAQIRAELTTRPDFAAALQEPILPQSMQLTRELIQSQLRGIVWDTPPILVLMPLPPIWRSTIGGDALHRWAMQVLQPLEDEGTIQVVDATKLFDDRSGGGCAAFADFYHQNAEGRKQLSDWLLPRLESLLYVANDNDAPED